MAGVVSRFSNNTFQGGLAANADVALNTVDVNQASSFVALSGSQIVLQPGTYELTGSVGGFDGTNNSARLTYAFYNISSSTWIGQGAAAEPPSTGDNDTVFRGPATAVITVTSPTNVALRLFSVTAGSQISSPLEFGAVPGLGRAWVQVVKF
jgi:hypothetical protein